MARPEKVPLEVRQAVEAGQASNVFRFRDKTVQIHGTFVATLQLEGSIDGSEYFPIGTPRSAAGAAQVAETIEFLRVRTTAYTSGEPRALLAGFDERAA